MLARTVLALALAVRVYDNTGLPPGDRAVALAVAQAILRNAGIAVTWCNDAPVPASAEVIVRIVAGPAGALPGQLGFSLIDVERRAGTLATVYADRVAELAALSRADPGRLLGRAITHEIGHLLLGTTHHADRGLMRGVWTSDELQRERPQDWSLSREDIAGMRRGLVTRLRRSERPDALVALGSNRSKPSIQ
jgi:hypothetical protein